MRKNLIPTIIQDINTKEVLMLGHSNKDSIAKTKKTKNVTFYSRSRKKLWTKGREKSGNFLIYKKMFWDCDRDALLILADPMGPTCHKNNFKNYSCFKKQPDFSLSILEKIIISRKKNKPIKSYTSKLLKNDKLIRRKIIEEAGEVILEKSKKRIIEEAADLVYHLLVFLNKKNIYFIDLINELKKRNNYPNL